MQNPKLIIEIDERHLAVLVAVIESILEVSHENRVEVYEAKRYAFICSSATFKSNV